MDTLWNLSKVTACGRAEAGVILRQTSDLIPKPGTSVWSDVQDLHREKGQGPMPCLPASGLAFQNDKFCAEWSGGSPRGPAQHPASWGRASGSPDATQFLRWHLELGSCWREGESSFAYCFRISRFGNFECLARRMVGRLQCFLWPAVWVLR